MLDLLELLQLTFALFRRNVGLYIGYSAWLLIPTGLIFIAGQLFPAATQTIDVLGQIVLGIMAVWVWCILTLITAQIIGHEKINTEKLSRQAWQIVPSLILVGLMVGIVEIVGLALFLIPGIIFIVWYGFAQMDVVLGGRRGLAAMAHSRDLVRGRFFPVLWRLVVGPLAITLGYLLISCSIISLVEFVSTGTVTLFSDSPSLAAQMLGSITDALVLPIFVIYLALLYLDLKQTHKGAKKAV